MNRFAPIALWSAAVGTAVVTLAALYRLLWLPPSLARTTDSSIVLTQVVNTVAYRPAGSIVWGDARAGSGLVVNDSVRTGSGSVAEISFRDNQRIVLGENTQIIIQDLAATGPGGDARLVLDEGRVEFFGSGLKVRTKTNLELDLTGSAGEVRARASGTAELKLDSGSAKILSGNQELKVEAGDATAPTTLQLSKATTGETVQVAALDGIAKIASGTQMVKLDARDVDAGLVLGAQGAPPKPVRLPQTPRPASGDLRLSLARLELGDALIEWAPVTAPDSLTPPSYVLRFFAKSDPDHPVTVVETRATRHVARDLPPGDYLYTVATRSDGLESKPSQPRELTVTLPPAPYLPLEPLEISAAQQAMAPPVISWAPIDVTDAAYRLRLVSQDSGESRVIDVPKGVTTPLTGLKPGRWDVRVSTIYRGYEGRPGPAKRIDVIDDAVLLPPSPQPLPQGDLVAYTETPPQIDLRWQKSHDDQSRFRIQVSRTPGFGTADLLVDEVVRGTSSEIKLRAGKYYWRVAALAGEKTIGPFSPPAKFELTRRLPPRMAIDAPMRYDVVFSDQITVAGRTDPGNRVDLKLVWAGTETLAVAPDGHFEKAVKIRAGRNKIVLTIVNRQNQTAERVHEILRVNEAIKKSATFATQLAAIQRHNRDLRVLYDEIESVRLDVLADTEQSDRAARRLAELEERREALEQDLKRLVDEAEIYAR